MKLTVSCAEPASQPGEVIKLSIKLSIWNVLITGRADKLLKGMLLLHDSDSESILMSVSTLSILHSRFARVFHMPTVTYDNVSN